jgi:hypothetical protein
MIEKLVGHGQGNRDKDKSQTSINMTQDLDGIMEIDQESDKKI